VQWSSVYNSATSAVVASDINVFAITGLIPHVEYNVAVFALNSAGESSGTTATQRTRESSNLLRISERLWRNIFTRVQRKFCNLYLYVINGVGGRRITVESYCFKKKIFR